MKNYLLGVLSILVIGLLSFNTIEEISTIKPAKPKSVFAGVVYSHEVQGVIYNYTKQGFIVKTISHSSYRNTTAIVMEKY